MYSGIEKGHRLDHICARMGINRMGHLVRPGLYRLGNPDSKSTAFASATYTLSFDALRSALGGIDSYILAANITAIAYVSRRLEDSRKTLLVGTLYAAGRTAAYVAIAAAIVYAGLNVQAVSFFLQESGDMLPGPVLIIRGILMVEHH